MFDIFKRRKPVSPESPVSPDARAHVVHPAGGREIPSHVRNASALRRRVHPSHPLEQAPKRGMWVVHQGRTGILTHLEPGDVATVMLVDDLGHNIIEIHVPAPLLRQAYFEEIPERRRLEYHEAQHFGYTRRPS
jgi:hypothetical protein